MSSCFAKNPIRDIGPQLEAIYLRIVNHVLKIMYKAGFILHGAAVRDLLNGICPRDFDFVRLDDIMPTVLVRMLTCDGICADLIDGKTSPNPLDKRFCIGIQAGSELLTNAPPIVLDIGVGLPVSAISYTTTEDVLSAMEPDYNVNMLYIESFHGKYTGVSTHTARVLGNRIVTDWGKLAVRSCEQYGVDIAYVLQSVIGRHALMMGCNGRVHTIRGPIIAHRRMTALTSAGYKDLTEYKCTKTHCCRSSAKEIYDELLLFIDYESKGGDCRYRESIKHDAQLIIKGACLSATDVLKTISNTETVIGIVKKHPLIKYRMVPRNLQTFPEITYTSDRRAMLARSAEMRELSRDTSMPRVKDQKTVDVLKKAAEEVFNRSLVIGVTHAQTTLEADDERLGASPPSSTDVSALSDHKPSTETK